LLSFRAAHASALGQPVVGGKVVERGAFPDVVAVLGADGGLCTGTLLEADLVLTAAHCIESDPIEVIVGSVDLARPDGQRRRVKGTRAYPDWIDTYDIGIVMLENPVAAKARGIVQGCARDRLQVGLPLQLVGFGLTAKTGAGDNTRLRHATVPVVDGSCTSDPACAQAVAPGGEFIAGGHGTDSCFGDSGGPVYIETARGPALIGVVSRSTATWSDPCGSGGVYVRADQVVAWIQNVSGRKVARVPCDEPADAPGDHRDAGGCNVSAAQNGFTLYYAVLVWFALRRARSRGVRPRGGGARRRRHLGRRAASAR
jgi:secreted trypsin-like serine protease